jgi:hypothetical protein
LTGSPVPPLTTRGGDTKGMHTMSNNNKSIVKAASKNEAVVAEPGTVGLETAVADFRATFQTAGSMLVERIRIVQEYRTLNADLSKNKVFRKLADAISAADPNAASGRYTGWKYATLERLGLIGDVFAFNGWELDAHTAHAAFTLVEKNRSGFTALAEGRKKTPTALDTLYKSTDKADAEKKAATNRKNAEKRAAEKAAIGGAGETEGGTQTEGQTPAAVLASLAETVGKQTWSLDEMAAFATSLGEYAAQLATDAAQLVQSA